MDLPENWDTTMGPHDKAEYLLANVKELILELGNHQSAIETLKQRVTELEKKGGS